MAKVADAHACRRLSMDTCLYSAKRASLQSEGLCLVCGRRATGRCSKCSIATFCGPQCQESATHSHSGACEAATGVLTRRIVQRWLPREDLSVLQHVIVLIGQNCNPVSSAKDHGLQGCSEVLQYVASHPQLLQRDVADFVFMGCQSLMTHRMCCNPHIYAFCIIDGCLKKHSVEAFADSVGVSIKEPQGSMASSHRLDRFMEWQRSVLMPMQEMFGQIGIGRYWESEPMPIEAGMMSQHSSPMRQQDPRRQADHSRASMDTASWHSAQSSCCKASTNTWVSHQSRLSLNRARSIPAHV